MAKLEFDVSVKDGGLKELNKQIREQTQLTSQLIAEYGKEATSAQKAGAELGKLKNQKRELTKATNDLSGGIKRTTAQLLEMGENITIVAAGIKSVLGGFGSLANESVKLSAEFNVLRANFQGTNEDLELFRKATAGTVTDSNLIKLSNQAGDLGISLDKQALLFSLAEDAADKYGGTVEDNFQKVVYATEGNIKGLKALGIQKEVYNKTVSDLVKSMGGEVEMLQGVNGEQEINIKKLDPAIQKQIRLEAILKLTGVTLDTVNKKTQDQKDKLEALNVRVEEAKVAFGDFVMKGVEPLITSFLDLGKTGSVVVGGVTQIGGALTGLLPVLASVKMAWNVSFASMASTLGMVSLGIANLVAHFNNLKGLLNIVDTIKGGWKESWFNQNVLGWGLDENAKNETGFAEGIFNAMGTAKNFMRSQMKNAPTIPTIKDKTGKTGRGKDVQEKIREEEKILNEYEKQLQVIAEINAELGRNIGLTGIEFELRQKLLEATQRLAFIESGRTETQGTSLSSITGMIQKKISDTTISFEGAGRLATPRRSFSEMIFGNREIAGEFMDKINSGISGVSDTLTQMMTTLGLEKDKFVSGLVAGFDRALQYINLIVSALNAVNTVKSIFSFASTLAGGITGGIGGGGVSPMVYRQSPVINVVVQSEIEKTKAVRFFDNYYDSYKSFAKNNSF